jgi:hypothetical protein
VFYERYQSHGITTCFAIQWFGVNPNSLMDWRWVKDIKPFMREMFSAKIAFSRFLLGIREKITVVANAESLL